MLTRDGLTDDEFCWLVRCAAFAILEAEPTYPIIVPAHNEGRACDRLAPLIPHITRQMGGKWKLRDQDVNRCYELTKKMLTARAVAAARSRRQGLRGRLRRHLAAAHRWLGR